MSDASELTQAEFKMVRDAVARSMDDGNPSPSEIVAAERLVSFGLIDVPVALDLAKNGSVRW